MNRRISSLLARCGHKEGSYVLNAQIAVGEYSDLEIAESLIKAANDRVEECGGLCGQNIDCQLRNLANAAPEVVVAMIHDRLGTLAPGRQESRLLS